MPFNFFYSNSSHSSQEKKGDVKHVDDLETPKYDAGFVEPDDKELRRLMWKLDLRIIPYIALLYLCSFLDRVNIGKRENLFVGCYLTTAKCRKCQNCWDDGRHRYDRSPV